MNNDTGTKFGLRVHHADGTVTDCPWQFESLVDLKAAFYEVEGEDTGVRSFTVIAADPKHPVWRGFDADRIPATRTTQEGADGG